MHYLIFLQYDSQWLFAKHLCHSRYYWQFGDDLMYAEGLCGFCENTMLLYKNIQEYIDSRVN